MQVFLAGTTPARQALVNATPKARWLKTAELHCTEFYPGTLQDQYTSAHAASFGLATQLLDQFYLQLCERCLELSEPCRNMRDLAKQPQCKCPLRFCLNPKPKGKVMCAWRSSQWMK